MQAPHLVLKECCPLWSDHDLTYLDTCKKKKLTQRSMQHLTMLFLHLAFKRAFLKAFREFRLFRQWNSHLLAWPCNKLFSAPNSNVSVLFHFTVRQAHELVFNNNYCALIWPWAFTCYFLFLPSVKVSN